MATYYMCYSLIDLKIDMPFTTIAKSVKVAAIINLEISCKRYRNALNRVKVHSPVANYRNEKVSGYGQEIPQSQTAD